MNNYEQIRAYMLDSEYTFYPSRTETIKHFDGKINPETVSRTYYYVKKEIEKELETSLLVTNAYQNGFNEGVISVSGIIILITLAYYIISFFI